MPLKLSLSSDGLALSAESEHGLPIALPRDLAAAGRQLFKLLKEQASRKVIATNTLTGEALALVLANWERAGPEDAGLRPRPGTAEARRYPAIVASATARRYDARGRVVAPAAWDELVEL